MLAIRALFALAAVYDGVLGVAFLMAPAAVFERFQVTPPNHYGYVQFAALLLILFGGIFTQVALAPVRCRYLIPYGVWLKLSYCGLVFWYWADSGVPWIWKPFAIADAVMVALFVWSFFAIGRAKSKG